MSPLTVLLSGSLCAGKTTLAGYLVEQAGASVVSARDVLRAFSSRGEMNRGALQDLGAKLEAETKGAWLASSVAGVDAALRVVDSVRTEAQRDAFACQRRLWHVHLDASERVRACRFETRADAIDAATSFRVADDRDQTVVFARLRELADQVIDTSDIQPDAVGEIALRAVQGC